MLPYVHIHQEILDPCRKADHAQLEQKFCKVLVGFCSHSFLANGQRVVAACCQYATLHVFVFLYYIASGVHSVIDLCTFTCSYRTEY